MATPDTTSSRFPTLVAWGLAGVVFVWSVRAPFGSSALTTALGVYSELFALAFEDYGFFECLGVPMMSCEGDSVLAREPYLHQPPRGWWPIFFGRQMLGKGPIGFRFFPCAFTAVASALIYHLIRRKAGAVLGLLGQTLALASPVVQLYAGLPGIEPETLFSGVVLLHAYTRHREAPSLRRGAWVVVWFLMGCLVSWQFYFFAPGLVCAELLLPRGRRRLRLPGALIGVGCVGFALVVLHTSLAAGSFDTVVKAMIGTATGVVRDGVSNRLDLAGESVRFLDRQPQLMVSMLGPFTVLLLGFCSILCLASRRFREDPLTNYACVLIFQGLASILVFNGRSTTHDYYWFPMGAAAAMSCVALARWLLARTSRRALALFVCVALSAAPLHGTWKIWPTKMRLESPDLELFVRKVLDPNVSALDWVGTPDPLAVGAMLYSERRFIPPLRSIPHLDKILGARDSGRLPFRYLVYFVRRSDRAKDVDELFPYLERRARARLDVGDWDVFYL